MEVRTIQNNDKVVMEGTITEAFPGGKFKVELPNEKEITGYVSGKMRRYNIRILLGDKVKIEMSPYDLELGRITYRYKRGEFRKSNNPYTSAYTQT